MESTLVEKSIQEVKALCTILVCQFSQKKGVRYESFLLFQDCVYEFLRAVREFQDQADDDDESCLFM
jgi:hypothetical protein